MILNARHYYYILGIPAAIYEYLENKRRERLEKEYGTYDALDENL